LGWQIRHYGYARYAAVNKKRKKKKELQKKKCETHFRQARKRGTVSRGTVKQAVDRATNTGRKKRRMGRSSNGGDSHVFTRVKGEKNLKGIKKSRSLANYTHYEEKQAKEAKAKIRNPRNPKGKNPDSAC